MRILTEPDEFRKFLTCLPCGMIRLFSEHEKECQKYRGKINANATNKRTRKQKT